MLEERLAGQLTHQPLSEMFLKIQYLLRAAFIMRDSRD